MITKINIGFEIKKFRKLKNLKQEDLAKKIKPKSITKDTISRIERGTSNYTIDMLLKIAEALDCGIEDFCPSQKQEEDGMGKFLKYVIEKYEEYKKRQ
jgi:transcriptional regulator with XRE-family HTH domain